MANGRRVLVVDGLAETEEVLKAVLEPRGLQVNRVRAALAGQELRDCGRPNVVVVHEDEARPETAGLDGLNRIPRVVIGSTKGPTGTDDGRNYLQQPFQYGELIQMIEQLLDERAA